MRGAAPKCLSGRTSYLRVRLAFHPYPQVIPPVCNPAGCGPPRACSARFALPTGSSPGFGSAGRDSSVRHPRGCPPIRPFGLAFAPAAAVPALASPRPPTRRLILQKARRHPGSRPGSDRPGAHGFRRSFTPLAGVLFTVPSRYWSALGRRRSLALGGGPPRFPPGSACRAVLTRPAHPPARRVAYGALTRSGRPFQRRSAAARGRAGGLSPPPAGPSYPGPAAPTGSLRRAGFGSAPFARRYWGHPLSSSGY
jgi:hypothetical protein